MKEGRKEVKTAKKKCWRKFRIEQLHNLYSTSHY